MCFERSKTSLGSSDVDVNASCIAVSAAAFMTKASKQSPSNSRSRYNQVVVNYCDGGSFAGDAEGEHDGVKLHYRGYRIRHGVVADLLSHFGMDRASKVIVAGSSAGGNVCHAAMTSTIVGSSSCGCYAQVSLCI